MDYFEVVERRYSTRAYIEKEVEMDKLEKILTSIAKAPSAGNLQAFRVYLVKSAGTRSQLASAALGQDFIAQAPLALVFCAIAARSQVRYGQRGASLYCVQDATIACTFAMLAATALGLDSVWVGAFDEQQVRRIVGAPTGQRPVSILVLGYGAEPHERPPRRSLGQLVQEV